jgi:hypothetical protein
MLAGSVFAQDFLWVRQFGSPDRDYVTAVASDSDGNVYVVGTTHGAIAPGGENPPCQEAFLQKRAASGEAVWTRQFGGPFVDVARAVAVGPLGEVYVAADSTPVPYSGSCNGPYDAVVRKFDLDGNELWVRSIGTPSSDGPGGLAVDSEGNIWVGGWTSAALEGQTSLGLQDVWVRKYDPNGNELVTVQFGTSGSDGSPSLAVDSSDNLYAVAWTGGAFPGETGGGGWDAYVQKLDSDGNLLFARQIGVGANETGRAVTVDGFDNVWIAGVTDGSLFAPFAGGLDVFLVKMDAQGNELGGNQIGGPSTEFAPSPSSISSDFNGNIWLIGSTQGALPGQSQIGSHDVFLSTFDQDANQVALRQLGTADLDWAGGIAISPAGHLYLVGYTKGVFPGQVKLGPDDGFVIRVDNPLTPTSVIASLIEDVIDLDLPGKAGQAQLNAALRALEEEPPDIEEAIGALQDFINLVEAQRGKKIPVEDADELIATAQGVIDTLTA